MDTQYKFTIETQSKSTLYKDYANQMIKVVSHDVLNVQIICLKNCKRESNVDRKIFFKGMCINCDKQSDVRYEWSIDGNILSTLKRLQIEKNYLQSAKIYKVVLKMSKNNIEGSCTNNIIGGHPVLKGDCTIEPFEGMAISTFFTISCFDFTLKDESLTYEIYHEGTILAASYNSEFIFRVTEGSGLLQVKIINEIGNYINLQKTIKINKLKLESKFENIMDFLDGKTDSPGVSNLLANGDIIGALIMAHIAIDRQNGISDEKEKSDLTQIILNKFNDVDLTNQISDLEMMTDVIPKCLENVKVNSTIVSTFLPIMDKMISNFLKNALQNAPLSNDQFDYISEKLLKAMNKLYDQIENIPDADLDLDPIELKDYDENYPNYDEFDIHATDKIEDLDGLSNTTKLLFDSIGTVASTIFEVNEEQKPIENTNFKLIHETVDATDTNVLNYIEGNNHVIIGKNLLNEINKDEIGVTMTTFNGNPLWWNPLSKDLKNQIVLLTVSDREGNLVAHVLKNPVKITSKIENSNVFQQIDGSIKKQDEMELYKIKYICGSYLEIELISTGDITMALTLTHPPFQSDFQKGFPPSKQNFKDECTGTDKILYIGIKSNNNLIGPKFTLKLKQLICQIWDATSFSWSTKYCATQEKSTSEIIICECYQIGMYVARVERPVMLRTRYYERTIINDLPLNYTIIILIAIMLLILGTFHCISWWQNKRKRNIINFETLIDTNPTYKYKYFITIKTSYLQQKRTSSHISLQINGSESSTRPRILNFRKLIFNQRNTTFYFSILEPIPIGNIRSLVLWINFWGSYPIWHCESVTVSDPIKKTTYFFTINKVFDGYNIKFKTSKFTKTARESYTSRMMNNFNDYFMSPRIPYVNDTKTMISKRFNLFYYFCLVLFIIFACVLFFGKTKCETVNEFQEVDVNIWIAFASASIVWASMKVFILIVHYVI